MNHRHSKNPLTEFSAIFRDFALGLLLFGIVIWQGLVLVGVA